MKSGKSIAVVLSRVDRRAKSLVDRQLPWIDRTRSTRLISGSNANPITLTLILSNTDSVQIVLLTHNHTYSNCVVQILNKTFFSELSSLVVVLLANYPVTIWSQKSWHGFVIADLSCRTRCSLWVVKFVYLKTVTNNWRVVWRQQPPVLMRHRKLLMNTRGT